MKKLHLVCNAHLDPVWMWNWDEGAVTALATFYSAVELAEEFDYIFCHNEVILYEYIEKYAPELFKKIQALVKAGKWHIMGGWYIQPDCMLPSGESFIRQITLGRRYFGEKFNSYPTTAINFDSFGHVRGLIQILKKCGYDSYIICRPGPEIMDLPNAPFFWKGIDDSEITVLRVNDETYYCSELGEAKDNILRKAKIFENEEIGIALWGVGNHGGGASRKDLNDIKQLTIEKSDEYQVLHSTPENYFAEAKVKDVLDYDLPCHRKSYTSISEIKQKHAQLENILFKTEKACSMGNIVGKYDYNQQVFYDAERTLCAIEFHDVLSGTCAIDGKESTIIMADRAIDQLTEEFYKVFNTFAEDYISAKEGENPFVIFNFQPYSYETVVETEILIPKMLVSNDKFYKITMFQDGKEIPSQVIKELSNINYDRRKRVAYKCNLNPLGVSRVDLKYEIVDGQPAKPFNDDNDIILRDSVKTVRISRKTGLMDSFVVDGKEYLSGGAFQPVMYDDNEDPWGWFFKEIGTNYKPFKLNAKGVFEGLRKVNIVEDGDILTEVESVFTKGNSFIKVAFKVYKDLPYVDVSMYILWNEKNKGLKVAIPTQREGRYFGQVSYSKEFYMPNGYENVSQQYVGVEDGDKCLCVYHSGVYGNSKKSKKLYLNLLNGSAYCAHPIEDRPLVDGNRYIPFIEQGKHSFNFRIAVNDINDCEKFAQEFVNTPYSVNMYPHGDGNILKNIIKLSGDGLVLSALKKSVDEKYIFRIFNNTKSTNSGEIVINKISKNISLPKYSFKTFVYDGMEILESSRSDIY